MDEKDKIIDYVHDIFTDLIISCMRSGYIPRQEASPGEWCIELSTLDANRNRDVCIGQLISINGDGEYTTKTIGGKIITWHNAEVVKIPDKYLRKKDAE